MTNKELAERIADDYMVHEYRNNRDKLVTRILSILSEYQGEAVYTVVHQDETKNPEK